MKSNQYIYIGIIGALAIHVIVLLAMTFTPIYSPADTDEYIEVDFTTEVQELEEKSLEEVMAERIEKQIANLTADANTERSNERRSFSSSQLKDMERGVDEDLKDYEKRVQEALEEERRKREANQDTTQTSPTDTDDPRIPTESYEYYGKSYNGSVTAEYDVPGREARKIDVPGYKCKDGGVVVVAILVSPSGQVTSAEINESVSSISSSCLLEEALASAKKSVFFIKSDAPKSSPGTITYRFIPQ